MNSLKQLLQLSKKEKTITKCASLLAVLQFLSVKIEFKSPTYLKLAEVS